MARLGKKLCSQLRADAQQLAQLACGKEDRRSQLWVMCHYDSYAVTSMQRLRQWALERRIPLLNHALRRAQTVIHGIEIAKDVRLGEGVWFIHPLGIVIGGNTQIGNRVRFFGNNTLGQAKEDGYPCLEDDVWVGAGARILGPIRIGARSKIGANAVVLHSIPPDSVAVGVPARVLPQPAGAAASHA